MSIKASFIATTLELFRSVDADLFANIYLGLQHQPVWNILHKRKRASYFFKQDRNPINEDKTEKSKYIINCSLSIFKLIYSLT